MIKKGGEEREKGEKPKNCFMRKSESEMEE